MPAVLLSPIGMITQLLSDQGVIGSGFKVNTYVGGSVSTPQPTYNDSTGTVLNSNPIIIGSNGRYQNVTVWAVPGTFIKMVVQDANNNTIVGLTIDNIPLINDTTTLLAQLANPVSGNGVDLIANGVKSYDIVTSVVNAPVPILASGQTLVIQLEGQLSVGDGLGGMFYWSVTSSATDDGGLTTIKPSAAGGTGRYLRLWSTASGTFTATLSGMASATTGTINYVRTANFVQLSAQAAITGTSNANTMAMTGFPAAIIPPNALQVANVPSQLCLVEDNAVIQPGYCIWQTVNSIGFARFFVNAAPGIITGASPVFTGSGTKGLPQGWAYLYSLI